METACCPKCDQEVAVGEAYNLWELDGIQVTCACGQKSRVEYDEDCPNERGEIWNEWIQLVPI